MIYIPENRYYEYLYRLYTQCFLFDFLFFWLCSTACIETGNGTSLNLNLHQYIDATSKPPAKWECLNVEQDLHA